MKTITPFKQLVSTEMERLQGIMAPRIPAHAHAARFSLSFNRYTLKEASARTRTRKGLLSRVFGI